MSGLFSRLAVRISRIAGHYLAFVAAVTILLIWLITGPLFGFSDTWQLVINTSTSIITFLMVFLIQNSQNRDMKAMHLKLDELIHSTEGADELLIDAEADSEEELDALEARYARLAQEFRELKQEMESKGAAGGSPDR